MGHEVSADLVIGCADELDEVGINTGLMQLGHQQSADCARFGSWLEQGGAPSGKGVDETGCGDGVGEVPWSCDEHDRMRLPLQMRADLFVLQREVGGVQREVDGLTDLWIALAQCLAGRDRHGSDRVCAMSCHHLGNAREGCATLLPGRVRPALLR